MRLGARFRAFFFRAESKSFRECECSRERHASVLTVKEKGVLDVLHPYLLRFKNDPDHIEPEGVARLLKARHPDLRRAAELALLFPVDGAHRAAEIARGPGLYLDECDGTTLGLTSRCDEIDVAAAVPEPSLRDLPPVDGEPPRGDLFALDSHRL